MLTAEKILSMTDPLTGVFNRRHMDMVLDGMMQEALSCDKSLALLMIDLDYFKRINDEHGYAAGDKVLRIFGQTLMRQMSGNLCIRYGGEEFVVIMPGVSLEKARIAAENLCDNVENKMIVSLSWRKKLKCTISIGCTALAKGDNPLLLVRRADKALYKAKKQGCNRVVVLAKTSTPPISASA